MKIYILRVTEVMKMTMTHTQRLKAAVAGKHLDRPCAAFWGPHLNYEELNARDLAYAMIANEEAYQWDFIKFDFSGMYFPEAFGQKIAPVMTETMAAWLNVEEWRVNHAKDWLTLKPLQVKDSEVFQRNVEAVKRVCDHYQGDVPVLPTVFSPVSMAGEFVAGYFDQDKLARMVEYDTKEFEYGLQVIEETLVNLMQAYVDAGAAGFFIGLQNGINEKIGHDAFMKYEFEGTSRIVNAVKDKTWFNMAHLCNGSGVKEKDTASIEWCLDLPVTAINYADTWESMPSFAEVRKKTDKVLVGGIMHTSGPLNRVRMNGVDRTHDFAGPDRLRIKNQLRKRVLDAIEGAGDKLVIAPGCGCYQPHRFPVLDEVLDEIAAERAAKA